MILFRRTGFNCCYIMRTVPWTTDFNREIPGGEGDHCRNCWDGEKRESFGCCRVQK